MADRGRWYWRTIEDESGWTCRHGMEELDRHATRGEAVEHLSALARKAAPSQVFAHHLDGRIETVALFDEP